MVAAMRMDNCVDTRKQQSSLRHGTDTVQLRMPQAHNWTTASLIPDNGA